MDDSARPAGYYEEGLWLYADATSYAPGDTATFFVSSPVADLACTVSRVGASEQTVCEKSGLRARLQDIPALAYREGCGWADCFSIDIGNWPSGYYRVVARAGEHTAEHFFVVRSANPGADARMVLVLATNTYQAYNSWGGLNLYGNDASFADDAGQLTDRPKPTPVVAWDRPFSRSLIASPVPTRIPALTPRAFGEPPGLPEPAMALIEADASVWDMPAGFVNKWEHQFVRWAEESGYALDYLAQTDLDRDPNALEPYALYLSVGHDEYWSWEERDAVEGYVDNGGHAAFFSGNTCFWQVRFERDGRSMVCHKFGGPTDDPLLGTEQQNRITSMWSDPLIGRPETEMTGVTFSRAGYARVGYAGARSAGGFTIYRPDHWALEGTDLFYGDQIGEAATLVGYETDGCAFSLDEGLPVPTGEDGAPDGFEIIGVAPAALGEPEQTPSPGLLGRDDVRFIASRVFDGNVDRANRGHATFGTFCRGRGEVFTAGTTEWAWGLAAGDQFIDRITGNVLASAG